MVGTWMGVRDTIEIRVNDSSRKDQGEGADPGSDTYGHRISNSEHPDRTAGLP